MIPSTSDGRGPSRYRAFVAPPFPTGADGQPAAVCPVTGRSALVDPDDLALLSACRTFAPLAVHAQRGAAALGLSHDPDGRVLRRLGELAAAGLLISDRQAEELLGVAGYQRPVPVGVVGIPTRGRPDMLARCAADLARSARDAYRAVELVVADGSTDPDQQAANRRVLSRLRADFPGPVLYAGPAEREHYVRALGDAGADPAAARFALLPDPAYRFAAGANRNLLALHAAGRGLLQLDDDTLSRAAPVPTPVAGVALTSHTDPTEFWFPPEPPDPAAGEASADLAGLHEALLGRGPGAGGFGGPLDLDGADPTFFLRLRPAGGRVRVTTAGVVGDSGMGSPLYYLLFGAPSRDRLLASEAGYRAAVGGGPVLRAVTRPTVTTGSVCMGLNLGLDLRDPLPPFPPVLRNEDGVFGAVVGSCFHAALMGHLPAAVWHLPPTPRGRPGNIDWGVDGVRSEYLLIALVRACAPPAPTADERRNLRILGEGLAGLGALPKPEFRAVLRDLAWDWAAATAARLTAALERYEGEPEWWAADVARLADRARDAAVAEHAGVPIDLLREDGPDEAVGKLQRVVAGYGHLLTHWHGLVAAAVDLRAKGVTPAGPVDD